MRRFLFIARAKIVGITDDEGLKALNGYGEMVFEIEDDRSVFDTTDSAIEQINKEYPDSRFETYDWKEIK